MCSIMGFTKRTMEERELRKYGFRMAPTHHMFAPTPERTGIKTDLRVRWLEQALEESSLPDCLEVTAHSEDNEIMGIRHKELPLEGIQYHPESIMSEYGRQQIMNFLSICREFRS